MRWGSAACTWLLAICTVVSGKNTSHEEFSIAVTACIAGDSLDASPALAELAALTLRIAGVKAHATPPPSICISPNRADSYSCREAILSDLGQAKLHVAILSVPAASSPAAWLLRDTGLDDLGDVTPPTRRLCVASPPARSLLDLADKSVAQKYYVSPGEIAMALKTEMLDNTSPKSQPAEPLTSFEPKWCDSNSLCATLFTSDLGEARLLQSVVSTYHLRAVVIPLGPQLHKITRNFENRSLICDWTEHFDDPSFPLGPPPCGDVDPERCSFESRRLVKWINTRALARSSAAVRALNRLRINLGNLLELAERKRQNGVEAAALGFLAAHPIRGNSRQLRVVVFLPVATTREVYDSSALAAAAALADRDLEDIYPGIAFFKVQTYDDRCNAAEAYKYLIDALGTGDYDTLTAAVGPACGAPFADVVRQGPSHGLPALAYTAQSPPSANPLALLSAGDSRTSAEAISSLMGALGWRRVVSLSEASTHSTLATASAGVDFVVHLELPDEAEYDPAIFTQWADRVARTNGRIIYICVEDARAVRQALCAGHKSGLTPNNGAVWILPSTLPPMWNIPTPSDTCSLEEIAKMIQGHISVAPEWMLPWLELEDGSTNDTKSSETEAWQARWKEACQWLKVGCEQPGPHAVLLYDTLRLWANTLKQLIVDRPTALDDLHDPELIRSLLVNATNSNYVGLTGKFEWAKLSDDTEGAVYARTSPLIIYQWDGQKRQKIGRWDNKLELDEKALKWYTSDGHKPDDGHDRCALQPLADALHIECRTASILLVSILLAISIASLTTLVVYCKRRAEKKYKAKLEALTLRRMTISKPVGLDPWEIPRERVVINRKLGMGAFGTVYGGHALLNESRGWTAVAVKTLKAGASNEEKVDFLSEAEAMKRFDHKNVVRLLAVITKTEPVCTVMEFMLYGDLKNYLLARRHLANADTSDDPEEQVSARRLTGMALDVARALSYLAQMRYVHRDVAARNCLVSGRRVVKLADFGMTRLVFENDYYRFSRKGMLPVRWMAPESLAFGVFLPASDVWSFGVLLYEIVTFGSLPYQGLSNSEVLARVKEGQTITLPTGLKPQLEGLIKSCWQAEYKSRPTASEVAAFIADTPRLLTPCLDVPLDALSLDADSWRLPKDRADARWVSWAAPASAATDTTYLSTDAPRESDRFLP